MQLWVILADGQVRDEQQAAFQGCPTGKSLPDAQRLFTAHFAGKALTGDIFEHVGKGVVQPNGSGIDMQLFQHFTHKHAQGVP